MKTCLTTVAALFASTLCLCAHAEQLELRAGTLFTPTLTATSLGETINDLRGEPCIIRLHEEASPETRRQLARRGLSLLSCLGPKTWIARSSDNANINLFSDRLAWAGPFEPSMKLHPWLAAGNVPMWTVARDQIEAATSGKPIDPKRLADQLTGLGNPNVIVYVMAHTDVDLAAFAAKVELLPKFEVLSKVASINAIVLQLPNASIPNIVDLEETMWVEPALPQFSELNDSVRTTTQTSEVQDAPYGLSGEGVVVMVYDGGFGDSSHPDFGGRHTIRDSAGQSTHATHVAGTIAGDGTASGGQFKGMAPAATIESYGFEQEGGLSEGFLYTDPGDLELDYADAILNWGAVLANNSIGTNTAPNGFPCEWTGDYGVTSNLIDSVVNGVLGAPIRIVWANGNERQTDRCGEFYNTTAPPACAKNHITVGAINSNDESMTTFSSWGPADDGRIKPDISAPGCESGGDGGVTSTFPGGGYGTYCGTSMSSPTICGISALIIEDWRATFPGEGDLWNSSLKALLANSGADLGNPGPDCLYGFGTVRTKNAIDALRAESIIEAEVSDGGNYEFLVLVDESDAELKITLAWDDAPATPLPAAALMNDLDLVVLSPAGERVYPWTINPADPGAPATQAGEDHINNMEQVSVISPTAGAWRISVRGTSVPVGPQMFSIAATPEPINCSSSGIVGLDRAYYPLDATLAVTVVDCDLNLDDEEIDTVEVVLSSDDDPSGIVIMLIEEDPAAAVFSGSFVMSSTGDTGTLHATHGSEVRAEYIDAEDSDGNTNVIQIAAAVVDGVPATPTDVSISEFHADGATIDIEADEPVRVTIRYGSTCESLSDETSSNAYQTNHAVRLRGLVDTFSYAFAIEIEDRAGNVATYDNGGSCWEFTIPDFLDYFAEQFGSFDLAYRQVRFEPIASADAYIPCVTETLELPVDPNGGTAISLGDDDSEAISLPESIVFYSDSYSSLHVNSNGSVTFLSGSTDYNESLSVHFDRIGVSMLFDDLNPSLGGAISWRAVSDGIAVSFIDVPEYGDASSLNTFQVLFGYDESITIAWEDIGTSDAIVGLSTGDGLASDFIPTDFSIAVEGCVPSPPRVQDLNISTLPGTAVDISLAASDEGEPDPPAMLDVILLSLPQWPLRDLDTNAIITQADLPYTFGSPDTWTVRYEPSGMWEGNDSFTYIADDGGVPPEGGESSLATVSIVVATGPQVVYREPLDSNPGWEYTGDWAFGQPQGNDGDPNGGATGTNVVGYNLNGDYPNNLGAMAMTTTPFDCSNLTGTTLRFQRWLAIESAAYDHASILASNDGGNSFTTIWNHSSGTFSDTSWIELEYDISAIADGQPDVRIRWVMGTTDGSVTFCGWNIDDVEIVAILPSDGVFGDLNGDGIVNGADVGLFLAAWGTCDGCDADFNHDGFVDGADFGQLLIAWSG